MHVTLRFFFWSEETCQLGFDNHYKVTINHFRQFDVYLINSLFCRALFLCRYSYWKASIMQNNKMFIFEDKYKPPALGSYDSMGLEIKAWDTRSIFI